jgi:hypothetical protein
MDDNFHPMRFLALVQPMVQILLVFLVRFPAQAEHTTCRGLC